MRRLMKMLMLVVGKRLLLTYCFLGIASGCFSFLLIKCITYVISLIVAGNFNNISIEYIILFSLLILLFIWVRRSLAFGLINMSQSVLWKLRKQIISLVLGAGYRQLYDRKIKIQTVIMNDVNILTEISLSVIDFSIAIVLAVCCLVYLSTISCILFSVTICMALTGILVYHFSAKKNVAEFQKARTLETRFQENFMAILNGFREVFIDPAKGKYIYDHKIDIISRQSFANNIAAFTGFLNKQITGQVLFYILVSSILLIFSQLLKIKTNDTISFIFTLLYLLTAIETIMLLLPRMARAKVCANELMNLKAELEQSKFDCRVPEKYIGKMEFDSIIVTNLEFSYEKDEKSFAIGPIDFNIHKGETVFIYGANGSGKTTFIHSLLGLCIPTVGEIRLNGLLVNSNNYPEYKTIFSVVFSDFYLFNEIPRVDSIDMEKWSYYLRLFELDEKVKLEGNLLSTTNLSAGQRKRLALIVTLLENKPVLVIDEWAADQDPYFRKKFYTQIIPLLKKEGICIIAITHDDKYYHCADRLFKMEEGRLIEEDMAVFQPGFASR